MVAVTAYGLPGDRERFLAVGFDAYLTKPYTRADLRAAVATAIQLRTGGVAPPPDPADLAPGGGTYVSRAPASVAARPPWSRARPHRGSSTGPRRNRGDATRWTAPLPPLLHAPRHRRRRPRRPRRRPRPRGDDARVTVFEKSRGVSGRAATRWRDVPGPDGPVRWRFDHGAQYLGPDPDSEVAAVLRDVLGDDLVADRRPVWPFDDAGRPAPRRGPRRGTRLDPPPTGVAALGRHLIDATPGLDLRRADARREPRPARRELVRPDRRRRPATTGSTRSC